MAPQPIPMQHQHIYPGHQFMMPGGQISVAQVVPSQQPRLQAPTMPKRGQYNTVVSFVLVAKDTIPNTVNSENAFLVQLLVISSKVTANDLVAPTACLEAINWLRWLPTMPIFSVYLEVFKQQYTSCMKVGTGENLSLNREYHKNLFGPLFYTGWNCPLSI